MGNKTLLQRSQSSRYQSIPDVTQHTSHLQQWIAEDVIFPLLLPPSQETPSEVSQGRETTLRNLQSRLSKKNLLQTTKKDTFIPAARFHVLTPLFDALCNAVGLGGKYRNRIVAKLDIQGKMQVLDAGCGSGSLALDVKKRYAKAALYAVDADPTILAIAEQKAKEAKQQIHFRKAFLQKLPFPDNSFDVVYSSLVFHHLSSNIKKEAMKEIHRVLKKDGRFLLIDFGRPKHILFAIFSWFTVIFEEGYDNYKGRIPIMVTDSGFSKVTEVEKYKFNIASLEAVK